MSKSMKNQPPPSKTTQKQKQLQQKVHQRKQEHKQLRKNQHLRNRQQPQQEYVSTSDSDNSDDSSEILSIGGNLSEDIADAITDITRTVNNLKIGDDNQRSLFINKIENLPKYKILTAPRITTKDELHDRIKMSIRCLIAVHILIETDSDLYQYTQETLNILKPTTITTTTTTTTTTNRDNNNSNSSTDADSSPDDHIIAEFLKPLISSQRNGAKKKDIQEICRLTNELEKVNKLLVQSLKDKTIADKLMTNMIKEYNEKLEVREKFLDKNIRSVEYFKNVYEETTIQIAEMTKKHDKEKQDLLTEVDNLKESLDHTKTCAICFEVKPLAACVPCGHIFCTDCISMFNQSQCPTCRTKITQSVVLYYP